MSPHVPPQDKVSSAWNFGLKTGRWCHLSVAHAVFFHFQKKHMCVCTNKCFFLCLHSDWFVRWYNVWMNTLSCWKFWTKSMKPDRFAATHLMVSRNHAHVKLYSGWESLAQVHTFPSKWHTVKLCLTNTLHKMYQLSIIELTWANFPLFGYWIFFALFHRSKLINDPHWFSQIK